LRVSGESFTLRAAERADIPAIAALAGVVWRAHYPGIISPEQIEYMLARGYAFDALATFLDGAGRGIELAEQDGALAGFAAWFETPEREVKLDKLYVHPARQRHGIGAALIARVVEHARALGGRHVILNVNKQNDRALAAYRKHHFGIREEVVIDIGHGFVMDDYVMQRTV
jgi:diamine N-acetyltransferase